MRRPKAEIQPAVVEVDYVRTIEQLAERGLSLELIVDLGFPVQRDDLRQAYKRGVATGVLNVSTRLYQDALSGNTRAAQLYLQAKAGPEWRSGTELSDLKQPITLAALRDAFAAEIDDDET